MFNWGFLGLICLFLKGEILEGQSIDRELEGVEPECVEEIGKPELETIEVFDTHEVLTNQVCCVTLVDLPAEVCSFGKFIS